MKTKVYSFDTGASKIFFHHDEGRNEVRNHTAGKTCTISDVRFIDFLATAKELGIKVNEI